MAVPTDLAGKIADAENAMHLLATGQQACEVIVDGYSTKFTPGNINQLREYIARLYELQCGGRQRGAIGVVF